MDSSEALIEPERTPIPADTNDRFELVLNGDNAVEGRTRSIEMSSVVVDAAAKNQSSRKRGRKRVLAPFAAPVVVFTTNSSSLGPGRPQSQRLTGSASSHDAPGLSSFHSQAELPDWHDDRPDLRHFAQFLAALLVTTGLATLSAWDAKQQCVHHETYALLDLVDDDNFQTMYQHLSTQDETLKCVAMFQTVILPTFVGTYVLTVIALLLLFCHNRQGSMFRKMQQQSDVSILSSSSPLVWLRVTGELLLLSVGILTIQVYNIISVMLKPRGEYDSSEADYQEDVEAQEVTNTNNPYLSLAAVDRYGYVGDNANLYYLSWISFGVSLALVYQLATAFVRLVRTARIARVTSDSFRQSSETRRQLLPATSWDDDLEGVKESRAMWFHSLYRLRFRTGIWVATLVFCLVIVGSSQHVWASVVWPTAKLYLSQSNNDDGESQSNLQYWQVCQAVAQAGGGPQLCRRTALAWFSGIIASALCATAIGMHLTARQGASAMIQRHEQGKGDWKSHSTSPLWEQAIVQNRLPLRTELALSILLALLLGFNAVASTGVQGPAATVGNLYYASWFSFLLCIRICLGCVEELYDIMEDREGSSKDVVFTDDSKTMVYKAPTLSGSAEGSNEQQAHDVQNDPGSAITPDPGEKGRSKRLRGYFFLSIFSLICAASAFDAASNQKQRYLSRAQKYMIFSPCAVSILSAVLFILCLSKRCYRAVVSRFFVGGVLAILSFTLWLGDLVLTMHSEESWAVDGIGEIEMANLYYFSWAGILTAGFQMMSYIKAVIPAVPTDYMSIVWVAICKVCFVILGAGLHIWHTIAGNCGFDEITYGADVFCSRTVLAIFVSLAGMFVGGLVVLSRCFALLFPRCKCGRVQAHIEMLVSIFLVLLFGAAVAIVTGIGGPGQVVGDLYYSTWLAFWVSLGIFVSCESEVRSYQTVPGVDCGTPEAVYSEDSVMV